jgi:uncharacterized membrane protein
LTPHRDYDLPCRDFPSEIAMCYQTSDVTVSSRSMRRITLFHAVISFLYVTAILVLVINILSNEI